MPLLASDRRRARSPLRRPLAAAGALALVLTAGCSSDEEATPTSATNVASELAGRSFCDDPEGDGSGGVDLRAASVAFADEVVIAVWAFDVPDEAGALTATVTADPYVLQVDDPGHDGTPSGTVTDLRTDEPVDAEVVVDHEPGQLRLDVPRDALDRIGDTFTAEVSVEGVGSDRCASTPLPGT